MYQHIALFKCVFDKRMTLIKVLQNIFIHIILKIYPFMLFYAKPVKLFLNTVTLVCQSVKDWDYGSDVVVRDDCRAEGVHPTQE